MFEAVPKSEALQARRFRGFIALDDVKFQPGEQCRGHCTFDSGLCKFSNDQSGQFQWQVVSHSTSAGNRSNSIALALTKTETYGVFLGAGKQQPQHGAAAGPQQLLLQPRHRGLRLHRCGSSAPPRRPRSAHQRGGGVGGARNCYSLIDCSAVPGDQHRGPALPAVLDPHVR